MIEDKTKKEEINLSGTIKSVSNSHEDGMKTKNEEQEPDQIFDPEMPGMVRWVIKYSGGIVKDERQASYVLIGFIVLAIIFSLFIFFSQKKISDVRSEDFRYREQFIPS